MNNFNLISRLFVFFVCLFLSVYFVVVVCACKMAALHRRGLTIDFTNIRGLQSNSASVEHHLSNSNPNLLLLSETQMSRNSSSNSFNMSNYNLFHNFRLKGGVCAYVNINTPVTRLVNLESPNFDVCGLKPFYLLLQ